MQVEEERARIGGINPICSGSSFMTLLTLNNQQKKNIHEITKELHFGDLILRLFSLLYLEEKTNLIIEQFNTRTAGQILDDNYATGCTDFAIVLCAFLKELNISYEYVDVLEKRWLDASMEEKKVMGHAFIEVNKLLMDPQRKIIYHDPEFVLQRYVVFGKGAEPHELGLTDFQTNMKKYFDFKENYKTSKSV